MEEEYLAPTEISYSTPFKKAFPGSVGNGNDSFIDGSEPQNDNDLDFLQNFQNLALSEKKKALKPKKDTVAQSILNSTVTMGVAESKENSTSEEAPSFLNFGDAPRTPVLPVQRRFRRSEVIGSVSEPVPDIPKARSAPSSPPEDASEPLMMGMKTPDPNLKRLQDEFMRKEIEFEEELMKQDEFIREKDEQLESIYNKIEALGSQKDKGKLKKYEQKIASLSAELESLQSMLVRAEGANVEVINEREQLYSDLRGVEISYNDLMGKYNRCKESVNMHTTVEMGLKNRDDELMTKIEKKAQQYDSLKSQVQEGVETLYREYEEKLQDKHHENESLKVRLMRLEMRVGTLENDLEQKTQENAQLHKLCDDIISGHMDQ